MELRRYTRKTMKNGMLETLWATLAKPESMIYNIDPENFSPVKFFNQKHCHLWFILDADMHMMGLVWITKYNALNQTGWGNLSFAKFFRDANGYCYFPSDDVKYEIGAQVLEKLMVMPIYRMLFVEVTSPEGLADLGFKKVGDIPKARWNHAEQKYQDVEMWYTVARDK